MIVIVPIMELRSIMQSRLQMMDASRKLVLNVDLILLTTQYNDTSLSLKSWSPELTSLSNVDELFY